MRLGTWVLPLVAAIVAASSGAVALLQAEGFPHHRHRGLFPLCQSCHEGITRAGPTRDFPEPRQCATCHDGDRLSRVGWTGPSVRTTTLDFSHEVHLASSARAGDAVDCTACHRPPGAREVMAVERARPERCIACHAHEAETHLDAAVQCTSCHLPLVKVSALTLDRIRALPAPESHGTPDFLTDHATDPVRVEQVCATCHARESCTRCHLNGDELASVVALEPDSRVAVLEAGRMPEYPVPASHGTHEWGWGHGAAALESPTSCGNCHARESCERCHVAGDVPVVASLSPSAAGDPRGVEPTETVRVHDPTFATFHGSAAASAGESCASCHSTSFCETCHDGPVSPAFHYPNFLQMHGADAWGNEFECSTCHNPDVFCRGCHGALGRGSQGRVDVAYHSRRPFWLFGHGAAARQGLESCRTCHSQSDCMVCHAAAGAWRVNPHGPGFAAEALRGADALSCIPCHRNGIPPS